MRWTVLALVVLALGLSSAWPQSDNAKPKSAAPTRVAVCNIGLIFNRYERAIQFKKELEDTLKKPRVDAKKLVNDMVSWEKELRKDGLSAQTKRRLEDGIRDAKRKLEDLNQEITRVLGKKSEDNLVTLWKEVNAGIQAYAAKSKIDLVFAYGDPIEKELLDRFPNVNRKMQAMDQGSSIPIYVSSRVDISHAVADALNLSARQAPKKKAPPVDF